MNITSLYTAYNFSEHGNYVFQTPITKIGAVKVEHLIPDTIQLITGVAITANVSTPEKVIGYLHLQLSEGILKSISLPILNTEAYKSDVPIFKVNETIKPNSLAHGFFLNRIASLSPFTLSVYLHYKK